MGIFDRILSKSANKVLNRVADNIADKVADNLVESKGGLERLAGMFGAGEEREAVQRPEPAPLQARPKPQRDLNAYFSEILAADFPDYQVQQGVSAVELELAPQGTEVKAYDFCLFKGNVFAGVIMLTPHNRDRNQAFLNARAACESCRIPFINFYTHMPNARDYVVGRIRAMAR